MTPSARTAGSSSRKNARPQSAGAEAGGAEQLLKIGEAAKLLGVEAYVLRFWETQFSFLRPRHAHSKHRFYAAQDLQTLSAKPGAAVHSEAPATARSAPASGAGSGGGDSARRTLAEVRRELESLHKLLER
jgi:hypothetical protein